MKSFGNSQQCQRLLSEIIRSQLNWGAVCGVNENVWEDNGANCQELFHLQFKASVGRVETQSQRIADVLRVKYLPTSTKLGKSTQEVLALLEPCLHLGVGSRMGER